MRHDEMLARDGRWAVRLERRLAHPVDAVWRALTESQQLGQWFPTEVHIDLTLGGAVQFGDLQGEAAPGGRVVALDPPRLLAFTWGGDELRFELAPDGDGTRLALVHTFDDKPGAASFGAGWQQCLAALAPALDGDAPPPASRAVAEHEQLVARFGLDRPTLTEEDARWTARFERQLTCPAEVAWDLFLTGDAAAAAMPDPARGEPLRAPAAPEVVLGVVTEVDRPRVLVFDTADDEPGDSVRLELRDGTGHGARLVLTVSGRGAAERDAALDQWGAGGVEHVAAQASAWALART